MSNSAELTQPSTQPLTQPSGFDDENTDPLSQSQSPEILYWGRLYPLKSTLHACDLVKNAITLGKVKSGCDIIIERDELPENVYVALSTKQFNLKRRQIKFRKSFNTVIELFDVSLNGTYVNGLLVRRQSRALKNNDIIGFPIISSHSCFDAYVYIDALIHSVRTIPFRVRSQYQITLKLGCGAFGEVFLVFDKVNCRPSAMKTVHQSGLINDVKSDKNKEKLSNELEILRLVEHPNVIKMTDFIDCRMEKYLFLEYMEGKDLAHKIQEKERLSESLAKLYFYQIASGVQYLHSCGITHRDLKPANILLAESVDETLLKLSDFGLSKIMSSTTAMKTMCGTKMFVAPEVLSGGVYSPQVDIWSMGVLLYVCLSGIEPFSKEPHLIDKHIKMAVYTYFPFEIWENVSTFAKLLIDRMLIKNPDERIPIEQIKEEEWLKDPKMIETVNNLYNGNSCSQSEEDDLSPVSRQKKKLRLG